MEKGSEEKEEGERRKGGEEKDEEERKEKMGLVYGL